MSVMLINIIVNDNDMMKKTMHIKFTVLVLIGM